jgi:hypothetical protein
MGPVEKNLILTLDKIIRKTLFKTIAIEKRDGAQLQIQLESDSQDADET